MKHDNDIMKIPKISETYVIRAEHFGGLLFNKNSISIMELNTWSYDLLKCVDGEKNIQEIIEIYVTKSNVNRSDVLKFIKKLNMEGILIW